MIELTAILFIAFLADLLIGDPRYRCHPIRIIGHGITFLEKFLRKAGCSGRAGGLLLVIIIEVAFVTLYIAASMSLAGIHPLLGMVFDL